MAPLPRPAVRHFLSARWPTSPWRPITNTIAAKTAIREHSGREQTSVGYWQSVPILLPRRPSPFSSFLNHSLLFLEDKNNEAPPSFIHGDIYGSLLFHCAGTERL